MGFASIINLRLATEQGADIDAEAAAAKAAGINFVHLPLNGSCPDPAVADRFLESHHKTRLCNRRSFIAPVETGPRPCGSSNVY